MGEFFHNAPAILGVITIRIGLVTGLVSGNGDDVFAALKRCRDAGFQTLQTGDWKSIVPSLDLVEMKTVFDFAREIGMKLYTSVYPLHPSSCDDPKKAPLAITDEIKRCHAVGMTEVRGVIGSHLIRFEPGWDEQLRDITTWMQSLAPLLRDLNFRILLENHGDLTTFELVRLIEAVGPDVLGICFDAANAFATLEDPLLATRRIAPYVGLVHAKDAIVYFSPEGLQRQVRPCGQGIVPWCALLKEVLMHGSDDLSLVIEDHPEPGGAPGFSLPIYKADWFKHFPDLDVMEMSRLIQSAFFVGQRIKRGEIMDPAWVDLLWQPGADARFDVSRRHLEGIVRNLQQEAGLGVNL